MREKKRYIVFKVISKRGLSFDEVKKAIKTGLLQFLGELGFAKAGVIIIEDWKDNKGVIKVNHKHVDNVKAGLALIKDIGNEAVIVKTIGVSGILKKVRSKFS